jgi:hypothetical protein
MGLPYPPLTGGGSNVPNDIQALAVAMETKFPRGIIGYALRTTQAGPVTSGAGYVTVSGLSITVTLQSSRTLMLNFVGQATSDQAATTVGARIWNRTTSGGSEQTTVVPTANFGMPLPHMIITNLPSGTYTFDIQLAWYGGSGAAYLTAHPQTFIVVDLGPS